MAINKRKILAAAQRHMQKGALDKALKEYLALVKLDPRDSNARLKLGDVQLRLGNRDGAIGAYVMVAEQFMKDGFDAKAVAIYKQVAKIDPKRLEIYEPLAELYQRLGLPSEALVAFQTAADAHHSQGRSREALDVLRKMATLDPTNTTSRLKIADLLGQANLLVDAVAEYDAVASELIRQGARDELVAVYGRILEIDSKRTSTLMALARVLVDRRDFQRAEPFAKRAAEANRDAPDALELLAEVYTGLEREDAASEVYRTLAEVYRSRGDEEKAREIAQRFVAAGELSFDPATSDFSVSEDSGGGPRAEPETLPDSGEGLELDTESGIDGLTGDPDLMLAEAAVYLRYGKTERAIRALEAILVTESDHRVALEKLGEACVAAGQTERAVAAWARAAEAARTAGDEAGFALIRDRLAAIDEGAAEQLAPASVGAEALVELELEEALDDGPEKGGEAEASDALEDASDELEDASDALEDASDESEAGAAAGAELEEIDLEEGAEADAGPGPETTVAEESTLASASSAQHVAEELEEADFYFNQGLYDEAEAIYERVIEAAPNQPQALLRLGEIAEARGDDPGSASGESASPDRSLTTPPDVTAESPDATLGDDLASWEDEASEPSADVDAGGEAGSPAEVTGEVDSELEIDVDLDLEGEADAEGDTGADDDTPASGPETSEATFDLAAELSDVFQGEGARTPGAGTLDDGIAAVFRDFKKGVAATLSEGDYETHYDLGIAYREMGLLDDAVSEFTSALAAPDRKLSCLHMLALCALDLDRAQDAVAHLGQALSLPDVPEDQQAVLRFDLGRAFEVVGDRGRASDAYRAVAEVDPEFQDVAKRLAALECEGDDGASAAGEADEGGTYETFDDVIAEAEERLSDAAESADDDAAAPDESPPPKGGKKRRRKISFL